MKISDVRKDIQKRLNNTINEIAEESKQIMDEELQGFYAGGTPSVYQRTGTLGTTQEVTNKYCTTNEAGVTVGLNENISYSTGTFSGAQVIDAAEHGQYGIVGRSGFWQRSEERIKDAADRAVRNNF